MPTLNLLGNSRILFRVPFAAPARVLDLFRTQAAASPHMSPGPIRPYRTPDSRLSSLARGSKGAEPLSPSGRVSKGDRLGIGPLWCAFGDFPRNGKVTPPAGGLLVGRSFPHDGVCLRRPGFSCARETGERARQGCSPAPPVPRTLKRRGHRFDDKQAGGICASAPLTILRAALVCFSGCPSPHRRRDNLYPGSPGGLRSRGAGVNDMPVACQSRA